MQNFANGFYAAYTAGFYYKRYPKKHPTTFFEGDLFYRNWHFDHKYAEYDNVEGYRFKGTRTETQDVYGMKLLTGETIVLNRKGRDIKFYVEPYAGPGLRYKLETFETFNGTVNDTYYAYRKDVFNHVFVTPQAGLRIGLLQTTHPH